MAVTKTILLVDDDNELREALAEQFDLYEGFSVLQAENANARSAGANHYAHGPGQRRRYHSRSRQRRQ